MQALAESFGAAPGNVSAELSSQSEASSTNPAGCMQDGWIAFGSPYPSLSESAYHGVSGLTAGSVSSQSVPAVTPIGGMSSPQSSPSASFMQALTLSFGAAPG